jgi:hypothetical protein
LGLRFPTALPVFFDEHGIAAHILGFALAIELLVLGPGSIRFPLLLVDAAKVICVLRPPLLVTLTFPASAAFCAAARPLAFFETRVRKE